MVVGVRKVQISAEGSTGAAAGRRRPAACSAPQTPGGGIGQALGGVGGALIGGLIGKATESAAVDTPRLRIRGADREGGPALGHPEGHRGAGDRPEGAGDHRQPGAGGAGLHGGDRPAPRPAGTARRPRGAGRGEAAPRRRTRRRPRPRAVLRQMVRPSPARRCCRPPPAGAARPAAGAIAMPVAAALEFRQGRRAGIEGREGAISSSNSSIAFVGWHLPSGGQARNSQVGSRLNLASAR